MSMGYSAGMADVITEAAIKKICPKEFNAFKSLLAKYKVDFENLAKAMDNYSDEIFIGVELSPEDEEKVKTSFDRAFKFLRAAFKKQSGGLELNLAFQDSNESGDRYDEINGAYWWVDGMYQLTPAGKKYRRSVERKFFVHFG